MARTRKSNIPTQDLDETIVEALHPLVMNVGELTLDPDNARTHDERNIEVIADSLRRFKQRKPIVVQTGGKVRAGNGTLTAAKSLGWTHIAVVTIDEKDSDAAAFAITDNRTSELAEWDYKSLVDVVTKYDLDPVQDALGFSAEELASIVSNDHISNKPSVPIQKPGKSKQDYGTPRDFLDAVEHKFGKIKWDLAAHEGNHVVKNFIGEGRNSLSVSWHKYKGLLWLNPPFDNIEVWAEKCALESELGAKIVLFVPASVGSNWFADHVFDKSRVYATRPRITFVGCDDPYPKDMILCHYDKAVEPGFELWRLT